MAAVSGLSGVGWGIGKPRPATFSPPRARAPKAARGRCGHAVTRLPASPPGSAQRAAPPGSAAAAPPASCGPSPRSLGSVPAPRPSPRGPLRPHALRASVCLATKWRRARPRRPRLLPKPPDFWFVFLRSRGPGTRCPTELATSSSLQASSLPPLSFLSCCGFSRRLCI